MTLAPVPTFLGDQVRAVKYIIPEYLNRLREIVGEDYWVERDEDDERGAWLAYSIGDVWGVQSGYSYTLRQLPDGTWSEYAVEDDRELPAPTLEALLGMIAESWALQL